MQACQSLDRLVVTADDDHAVANGGLLLTATLAERLDAARLADELVDLGEGAGAANAGEKVMTLVHSLLAGGDCIDDVEVLRSGSTAEALGHRVAAPSTVGTFLRSFTFGPVRQLDAWSEALLTRAWAAGAGPGDAPVTVDVDSTIQEVHGYAKEGAAFGYTRRRGYHPLLATRADTGEVLHVRFRKGSANTGRGAQRFVRELIGRLRRAGATGPVTLRADSGFWSAKVVKACRDHQVRYSITVNQHQAVRDAIGAIEETAWRPIAYTASGEAQVAETPYGDGHRLVVRRTRLLGPQGQLFPDWRCHAFITDRAGSAVELDADHRRHAVVELAIRDLKEGSGLSHAPSGRFFANAAWAVLATVAHNLLRWTAALGLEIAGPVVAKTLRRRYLNVPGRLTRSGRQRTLHLPRHWPWTGRFLEALARLRTVVLRT